MMLTFHSELLTFLNVRNTTQSNQRAKANCITERVKNILIKFSRSSLLVTKEAQYFVPKAQTIEKRNPIIPTK